MGVKKSKGPVRLKSTIRSYPAKIIIADLKNVTLAPSKGKQSSDPAFGGPSVYVSKQVRGRGSKLRLRINTLKHPTPLETGPPAPRRT